jgi:phosphatidylserine/phosphatidylglycerophosphate/cardiolipin synthase-like enzyme
VIRTYPAKRPPYPFAPEGERSIARAYRKAIGRAQRLIYLEDQYVWSRLAADILATAMRRAPELRLIAVVPRFAEHGGRSADAENVGRHEVLRILQRSGGPRVAVFDLENEEGAPIYIHAKVCIIDDVWACVGSDNFNRRSWTHDSELSCAVLDGMQDERAPRDPAGLGDGARVFARDLRLRLLREHLDRARDVGDDDLIDPDAAVKAITASAQALEDWHVSGRKGARPPGRIRPHRPERLGRLTRLWAVPAYRMIYDPDGRSYRARLKHEL